MSKNKDYETPMMQQYMKIKAKHPDCLLFFRLGDFYEMFLDDAKVGAEVLDITLTARARGKDGKIPMAGIPFHALDSYLPRLVSAGHKVAICEQLGDPNDPGLVQRGVVRIVTPGTVLEEKGLNKKSHNFVVSIVNRHKSLGYAIADISTGTLITHESERSHEHGETIDFLSKFDPNEIVLSKNLFEDALLINKLKISFTKNIYQFDHSIKNVGGHLKKHFGSKVTNSFQLEGVATAQKAASFLLEYLEHTQQGAPLNIKTITRYKSEKHVVLDRAAIKNLELLSSIRDQSETGTLVSTIDKTVTSMGGRLLKEWVLHPIIDLKSIEDRQDLVEELLIKTQLRKELSVILKSISDIERLTSRLTLGIGNARDVVNLKESLIRCLETKNVLDSLNSKKASKLAKSISEEIKKTVKHIQNTIVEEPPFDVKNGGLIRENVSFELDKIKNDIKGSHTWIANLEELERNRTGISNLKVRFNKVFGYYIEISKSNLETVPKNYERKQTLVNAERFITPELKEHETKILSAEEKINEIEYQIFLGLLDYVSENSATIQTAAKAIAQLDCLMSFAKHAEEWSYCKPKMTTKNVIEIENGRHPVVETLLYDSQFVPNDTRLDDNKNQLKIITGPNMAGKSVYMRQVALVALLAHTGSFVPAETATIGIRDKIFVRSGASDSITSGMSTFMVEMAETANILKNSTKRSLVIMDEIGRGTSTYDGISIAWAVAEYLATNEEGVNPQTLFATHYHELEKLAEEFSNKISNLQTSVVQKDGTKNSNPVFLYRIVEGGAAHSYGISVAEMAGVPKEVIKSAKKILKEMENEN